MPIFIRLEYDYLSGNKADIINEAERRLDPKYLAKVIQMNHNAFKAEIEAEMEILRKARIALLQANNLKRIVAEAKRRLNKEHDEAAIKAMMEILRNDPSAY